jgi:hypothetical protein
VITKETKKGPTVISSKNKQNANISNKLHIPDSYFCGLNMWIFKVTGQNRGIGIHVFNDLKELNKFIKMYTRDLPD